MAHVRPLVTHETEWAIRLAPHPWLEVLMRNHPVHSEYFVDGNGIHREGCLRSTQALESVGELVYSDVHMLHCTERQIVVLYLNARTLGRRRGAVVIHTLCTQSSVMDAG